MGQTHLDSDTTDAWAKRLQERAAECVAKSQSLIASEGEELANWQTHNVDVAKLPDDEQGILRISIGGGQTPLPCNYCRFRGDHSACVDLLRQALKAMENPEEATEAEISATKFPSHPPG